jgi:hypothetical protein
LLHLVATEGQEEGTVDLADAFARSRVTPESPRQLPRGPIQTIVEAREPRLAGPRSSCDLGKRCQVDAVEPSQLMLFGELAGCPTEGIGGVQLHEVRPLFFELALRRAELGNRERAFAPESCQSRAGFRISDDRRCDDSGAFYQRADLV